MYVHYCTCILHILVWTYLFRLTSFFDYLSFMWIVFKTSTIKDFNTAIPVRSLGPYMYVHYCTCILHILVWTYLFRLTSFFDYLSFMWIVFKTSI